MEKTITHLSELDLNGVYTYADYLLWRLEERIERAFSGCRLRPSLFLFSRPFLPSRRRA